MTAAIRALYADLAHVLGVPELLPDDTGGIQLTIGEDIKIILFSQGDDGLLVVAPLAALPSHPDYATMVWLLRRNFYNDGLAPFTLACDEGGTVILWGRLRLAGLTGETVAGLLDAIAGEATTIRNTLEPPEG